VQRSKIAHFDRNARELVRITSGMAAGVMERLEELVDRTSTGRFSPLEPRGIMVDLLETLPMPTYRGKDYAIRQRIGHNHWEWEAYANKGDAVGFAKGKISGSRDDAVRKAREAIDKRLGKRPKNHTR
jgi:hypothetical protein